jgi:xanthine dehydrogenase accessory factor
MKSELLEALQEARAQKLPAALATELTSGAQALVTDARVLGDLALDGAALAAVRSALSDDKNGALEAGGKRLFVQTFNPPLRMFVVGAVHIAQALVPMASLAGYAVTVIDPRGAFATEARFPEVAIRHDWPDEAMAQLAPDRRTAVVTLTHDPKIDDPALEAALRSDVFYVGALGSTRTHAKRLERLTEKGFGVADFARIHGPVGLSIGAKSPAEIAISILGQITQVLHAREMAEAKSAKGPAGKPGAAELAKEAR